MENLKKVIIKHLKVTNYRNFSSYKLSFSSNLIALIGSNGIGKTNLLEAISLLSPGRGIRSNKLTDLENYNSTYNNGWSVKIDFNYNNQQQYNFITSKDHTIAGRNIIINDNKITNQQSLTKYLNIIFLTPLYDSIFIDSKSVRRKFFDRITYNLFPDHLENLHKYEYYIKERMAILAYQKNINQKWLDQIEDKIATIISKITISRVQTVKYLNAELAKLADNYPKSFIFFTAEYEELYIKEQCEDTIAQHAKKIFFQNRMIDQEKRITNSGAHKTDFKALLTNKNIEAQYCSTGEQKSLLISLTLAQARMLKKYNNKTPILLLDEVFSHLDHNNAYNLLTEINNLEIQSFMTGTNDNIFAKMPKMEIINLT